MNSHFILLKQQAGQIRGKYGIFSRIEPVALPDGNYIIPEACKYHPDLKEVRDKLLTMDDAVMDIIDLPDFGKQCVAGRIYKYSEGEEMGYSGLVVCVQTHNRTIYPPQDTPALFSFHRENSDDLIWIPNEKVDVGWKRIYKDLQYEVIQAHLTLDTWTPDITPALWKLISDIPDGDDLCATTPAWVSSDHWTTYSVGDKRKNDNKIWEVHNVGFTYYEPSSPNGRHGWTFIQDCS